jgi:Sulfatase-modifying factor enzyme 1
VSRRTLLPLSLLVVVAASALAAWRLSARSAARDTGASGARGTSARSSAEPALGSGAKVDAGPPPRERPSPPGEEQPETLTQQRERLYRRLSRELELDTGELAKVRAIVDASAVISQGNPTVSKHPMTPSECYQIRERAGLDSPAALGDLQQKETLCGERYMVPVWGKNRGAKPPVCIDQYEFPDIPCEYPVVYPSAREAAELCRAVGKRLCDAHEWEGACAGEILPAEEEYLWDRPRRLEMEYFKNQTRQIVWAYGPEKDHSKCATASHKSPKCDGGSWEVCGSNTYPTGAFPLCVSKFGVYDQHGNAAEHMNLPMKPEELTSRGGVGMTEMKGSWFIFLREEAHPDDCRWRAPSWHETRVDDLRSHRNYHLGFRCCKTP